MLSLTLDWVLWLQGYGNAFWDWFFGTVSFFGEELVYIALIGFVYWLVGKHAGAFLGMALAVSVVLNNTLKEIINYPRPFEIDDSVINKRPDTSTGSAMPSGHVQNSAGLYFAVAFWLRKPLVWTLASAVIVLMMISRMYLGVHFFEDVIVGATLGLVTAFLLFLLTEKLKDNVDKMHRAFLLITLLFLPGLLLIEGNDYFIGYGILVGLLVSIIFERKYVNFTYDILLWKKGVRYALGLALMGVALIGFGTLIRAFNVTSDLAWNLLSMVRYFMVAFVGFGLYPLFYKRFGF